MKKIILSILAFVVLATAIIGFMIVRSFDVENYKDQVLNSLAILTGKPKENIKINGETTLSLRPTPTFIMNNLTIPNQAEGSEPDMIKVNQVQVEMEWTSFFKSPLVIKRIILKKPDILVERKYTYQTNFSFPVLFQINRQVETNGLVKGIDMASVRINELKIEEGTLRWKNLLTDNSLTFSNLNGVGSAETLDGPYSFQGEANFEKQKMKVEIKTGKMQISAPLPISLKLSDEMQKSWLSLSADLNQDSKDKWFFGGGSFLLENPKTILTKLGLKDWYAEGALSGSYKVNLSPKKIIFTDVVLSQKKEDETLFSCVFNCVNDYNEKKTYLDVKRLNWKDFDASLWQNILKSFNLQNTKNTFDIKVASENPTSTGILGDKISLLATLIQGKLEGELIIAYPQDTSLSLKGSYNLSQNHLLATASFGSSNMLALLKSLPDLKADYLPQETLKNVHLEGQLDLSPALYQYDITKGAIDETTLSGKVGYIPEKETWMTDLKLKDLNIDKYYTVPPQFLYQWYSFLMGKGEKETLFKGDYQLGLEAQKLRLLETDFTDLKVQGNFTPTALDISALMLRRSEDDYLNLTGQILNLGTSDISFNQVELSGTISDFELSQKLGIILPEWLTTNHRNLNGFVKYTGGLSSGQIHSQLMADNAELSVSGQVQNLFEKALLNQTDVHFKYPNISHLARLIYPDKNLFEKSPLSVDFQAKISTSKETIQWTDGVLYLGDDRWNTQGSLDLNPFKLKTDIKATRLNADLLLNNLLSQIYSSEKGFQMNLDENISLNVSLLADILQYQGYQMKNLKSQFTVEDHTLNLKDFSVSFPENAQSLFNISALGRYEKGLSLTGKVKMKDIPLPNQLYSKAGYTIGGGLFSTEFDFSASGNTFENLRHSLSFQGPFSWKNPLIEGVDISVWQEAVTSALEMAQITSGFKSRLEFAFKNGSTKLPSLAGTVQSKMGTIKFSQVIGQNNQISLDGSTLDWEDIGNTMHLTLSFALKTLQKSLPIVLDITGQSSTLKMYDFIQSFQDNVQVEAQRLAEIQKQAQKKEAEERRQHIQQNASTLFAQTDELVKSLQKKVLLNSSQKANDRLKQINKKAKEVRQLAAKTNLSEAENTALLEKSKVLFAEAKDFESWLGTEDLLSQKELANEIPEKSEKLLNQMEKIYQQNPRSVVMANLVVNSRQVKEEIKNLTNKLEKTKSETEVKELLSAIKENYLKLQKASDYMEKLNDSL